MITGVDIGNLKKTLAKNPKSLLFAQYAEVLRQASVDNKQKLDEALLVVNKGMEFNPDFLPGKLARGRILLEKGDLPGARIDFETVAKRDPFCFSALKLLLETAEKQGQPLQTEIYANILNTFELRAEAKGSAAGTEKVADLVPFTRTPKAKPSAAGTASLSAALDNLLEEDEKEETEMETLIFKTVDNIIVSNTPPPQPQPQPQPQPPPQPPPLPLPEATSIFDKEPVAAAPQPPKAPNVDDLVKEQLADKPVGNIPDLTGDINSLLATSASSAPSAPPEPKAPNVDDLVKEQLADKPVGNIPDLTGDIDSLLATSASSAPSAPEPKAPDIDDLVKEQLADKPVGNIPDLTGDIDSLLATSASSAPSAPPEPKAPDIDDLVKEQLADKPVGNIPDLTGAIDSLLSTSAPSASPAPEPKAPDIDHIVKEQLSDRVHNLPDLTGAIDSLLATSAPSASSAPPEPKAPNVDDLVKEQLADKPVGNIPDLTGAIDSLLATAPKPEPEPELRPYVPKKAAPPKIDDIVKEQLSDRVDNLPDLTGAMDSLLANADILTQKPTQTLAQLYMDQGLPQKAAAVYKELLAQEPGNEELKKKLALAENAT
ncbi:MAG: hypothetical protein LBQ76_08475 [Candidatus Fibromonas sp.]|jgi:tetratricopeptide (TPR) repeat protein|nr:hypothetical protein [Candidatus Fibromonas sp.]